MDQQFRELNVLEKVLILRLAVKGLLKGGPIFEAILHRTEPIPSMIGYQVRYSYQPGDFTVCTLTDVANGIVYTGASHRSNKDKENKLRGEMLALKKAILFDRGAAVPRNSVGTSLVITTTKKSKRGKKSAKKKAA